MKTFAQKHPVLTFLLITFAWSWLFWLGVIPFREQAIVLGGITDIGAFGPAIGAILTLGLRSGLKLDMSLKKTATMAIASLVIFALISLQYLTVMIPNSRTLIENQTPLTTAVNVAAVLVVSLLGGWVISSAVSSNTDIRFRMASILPRRLPPGWTVLELLSYPVIILVTWRLALLLGAEVQYPPSWGSPVLNMLPLIALTLVMIFLMGGGNEEPGWRGFMQPELQKRFSPLVAALIVSVFWSLWHLPLHLNGVYPGDPVSGMMNQGIFIVFFAIFLAWSYNRSGGNLFLMMFMHAEINLVSAFLPISILGLVFWLVVAVAVVVKDKMWQKLPDE